MDLYFQHGQCPSDFVRYLRDNERTIQRPHYIEGFKAYIRKTIKSNRILEDLWE